MKKRYITPTTEISVIKTKEEILLSSSEKDYGEIVAYNDERWLSPALDGTVGE